MLVVKIYSQDILERTQMTVMAIKSDWFSRAGDKHHVVTVSEFRELSFIHVLRSYLLAITTFSVSYETLEDEQSS